MQITCTSIQYPRPTSTTILPLGQSNPDNYPVYIRQLEDLHARSEHRSLKDSFLSDASHVQLSRTDVKRNCTLASSAGWKVTEVTVFVWSHRWLSPQIFQYRKEPKLGAFLLSSKLHLHLQPSQMTAKSLKMMRNVGIAEKW